MNVRVAEGNKPFHLNMVCVYCHGDIADAAVVCTGCGVACHGDCKTVICPTIGCTGSKDRPESLREQQYRQLERAEYRNIIIYTNILAMLLVLMIASFVCSNLGVADLGIAWSKITGATAGISIMMLGFRALLSVRYESKLERLCKIMIEDDKASQAEIAHLRSGQPEKKG